MRVPRNPRAQQTAARSGNRVRAHAPVKARTRTTVQEGPLTNYILRLRRDTSDADVHALGAFQPPSVVSRCRASLNATSSRHFRAATWTPIGIPSGEV